MDHAAWRYVKYECVDLHAFETGSGLRDGLGRWFAYCDDHRPHSRLAGKTPGEAYNNQDELNLTANLPKKARPPHSGLFAVGEVVGGFRRAGYYSASSLSSSATFGMFAGRAAAGLCI